MPQENKITETRSEQVEPEREQRIFTFKATQFIWLLVGILEVLIALRIFLKLVAANSGSPVAALIYGITDFFLMPFAGLTGTPSVGGSVLEISSFFAMVIYLLIGWAVERLVWLLFHRPRGHVVEVTETRSHEDQTHIHDEHIHEH